MKDNVDGGSVNGSRTSFPAKHDHQQLDEKTVFTSTNGGNESVAWIYSFGATMVPFASFCYAHQRGLTVRVLTSVAKSPVGVYGFLALPFCTLAMEKSIYDTVQAWQGIDPNVIPEGRGGFPSGGGNLPSFSLIAVQKKKQPMSTLGNDTNPCAQIQRKITSLNISSPLDDAGSKSV